VIDQVAEHHSLTFIQEFLKMNVIKLRYITSSDEDCKIFKLK